MRSLLILTLFAHAMTLPAQSLPGALNNEPVFARLSCNSEWTRTIPAATNGWTELPPIDGKHTARISEIYPGEHKFWDHFVRLPDRAYTLSVGFNLTREQRGEFLGLLLPSIGSNWEVYLNGSLIRTEMHLSPDGRILRHRAVRNELIELPPDHLLQGRNLLTFHILGEPDNIFTGFMGSDPIVIDRYASLVSKKSERVALTLLGLYFFAGLYHLLLFSRRTTEIYNLSFGMLGVLLSVYLFSRSNAIFELGLDSDLTTRIELAVLFVLLPCMVAFLDLLAGNSISLVTKVIAVISALLIFSALIVPVKSAFTTVLTIFQIMALPMMIYGLWSLLRAFVREVRQRGRILSALLNSPIGNLLPGFIIFVFAAGHDVLQSLVWRSGVQATQYGFFVFIAGIAGALANRFMTVYNDSDRLNKELAEKNDSLSRMDRLKDEFLANTSHELRTPLNGIIGLAEATLEHPERTGQVTQSAEMIVSSGRRLAALVNDLLDFSKLRNADLAIQSRPIDLQKIAELTLFLSKPLAQSKSLALLLDAEEGLPLAVGDENRLQQILLNLVGNGVKFTHSGSVTIRLRKDGAEILTEVADTGIGIAIEKHAAIFESFEQADGSIAREYGGTGLGLAIVRSLLRLHKSDIAVASEPGGAIKKTQSR